MPAERIDVVVHLQSVVHSMVEYDDGFGARAAGPARHAHAHRATASAFPTASKAASGRWT